MRVARMATAAALLLSSACGDSSGSGGEGAGGGPPLSCDPATLCLEVVDEGEIPTARFTIVWFRIEGSVAADPTVALDLPFDPTASYVEVNVGDVPLPPDIDKICERDCAEPGDCPACTGSFEASVAYVMVVADADASGSIEPGEVAEPGNVVGIANAAIGWSSTGEPSPPAPFDETFPNGTVAGSEVYRINASGAFEPADEGQLFQLKIGPDVF